MRKLLSLIALIVSVACGSVLAGCGGGGGGGSKVPANPVAAVQQRSAALLKALQREDVDEIMKFYSVTWTDEEGTTLAELRADLEEYLPQISYVDSQSQDSYVVSEDGTEVVSAGTGSVRFRIDATGEIITMGGTAGSVWRKQGEQWFIVYSEDNLTIQQAMRRRKTPLP